MRSFQGGANLATGGNKMRRALRHAALLLSGWLTAGFAPSPSSSRRTVRLSSVVPQIDSRELLLALERLDNAFLTHLYEADADDFVTEPSTVTEEHAALARGFKLSADGSWRMDVHEGPKLYTRAAVASGDAFPPKLSPSLPPRPCGPPCLGGTGASR